VLVEIEKDLEESNLPFIVELVNWKHMRPAFQKAIQKDLVLISSPSLTKKEKQPTLKSP
jgi:hypothetical protein